MDKTAKICLGLIAAGVGAAYLYFNQTPEEQSIDEQEIKQIIGGKTEKVSGFVHFTWVFIVG